MATSYVIPPAGISAAAFYAPGVAFVDPDTPPGLLCDNVDPATGELKSLFTAPHPVDAAREMAFRVRYESGAATGRIGNRFHEIRHNDDRAAAHLTDEAKRILKPFVDLELLEIESIQVDTKLAPDLGALMVRTRNRLTTERAA